MYPYQAKELLQKYKTGTCTAEEKAIVESWHIKEIASSDFMPDEEELERVGQSIWAALPVHEEQYTKSRTQVFMDEVCGSGDTFLYSLHDLLYLCRKD